MVTVGYSRLRRVTAGYSGLRRGYSGLQQVTEG